MTTETKNEGVELDPHATDVAFIIAALKHKGLMPEALAFAQAGEDAHAEDDSRRGDDIWGKLNSQVRWFIAALPDAPHHTSAAYYVVEHLIALAREAKDAE